MDRVGAAMRAEAAGVCSKYMAGPKGVAPRHPVGRGLRTPPGGIRRCRPTRWARALLLVAGALALLAVSGCAGPAPQTPPAAPPPDVLLPDWAPENPSPEFLRAARVIEPQPEEFRPTADTSELTRLALHQRYTRTLVPAWEFFGTLSDDQIDRLIHTKSVDLRYMDLSEKQRSTLLRYFDVHRDAFAGLPPEEREYGEDPLVELYKAGAFEDLSNVEIEFAIRRASGIVVMWVWVRQADGSRKLACPAGLGRRIRETPE